ncbi:hypothetical protein GGR54DRAFT_430179 [Hypoxylon sp. NC1633]|nr:hypothetical protein GGR54DRAFT_430179 [Hypoxylon sp. NC1633]
MSDKLNSQYDIAGADGLPSLHGIGLAVFITSIVLAVISTLVVCLRVFIRWYEKSFWWDDGLMFGGLIMYIVSVGLSCRSTYFGIGMQRKVVPELLQIEAREYMTIWALFYSACLVLIKTSICMTMLRLTVTMRYIRFVVYALLALSISSFLILFVSTIAQCRPLRANWDPRLLVQGAAECGSEDARMGTSYASTMLTIATDIACAIVPAVILWSTQLKRRTKFLVSMLLSFGSFASVCTMIRAPYIKYYTSDNILYWMGYVILWSNVETGIGLMAGSAPVLQKVILSHARKSTAHSTPNVPGLVTFGSVPVKYGRHRGAFRNPTDTGFTVASVHASRRSREWECLEDASLGGIRADYTYEVELEHMQGPQSVDSGESREMLTRERAKANENVSNITTTESLDEIHTMVP